MNLTHTCSYLLTQLQQLVSGIRDEHFSRPSEALSQSTIGQHIRHTLEFFICFERGFHAGTINYDNREHDRLIETDRAIALHAIAKTLQFIRTVDHDKQLTLEAGYDYESGNFVNIGTNALRELVYNIEHTVHHMAIIKIGIREVAPYVTLPEDFGIAASTIRHRSKSAESHHS